MIWWIQCKSKGIIQKTIVTKYQKVFRIHFFQSVNHPGTESSWLLLKLLKNRFTRQNRITLERNIFKLCKYLLMYRVLVELTFPDTRRKNEVMDRNFGIRLNHSFYKGTTYKSPVRHKYIHIITREILSQMKPQASWKIHSLSLKILFHFSTLVVSHILIPNY